MTKVSKVRFSKIVGVNRGKPKRLKRVNATNVAYAVLQNDITLPFMKKVLRKNRQSKSKKAAKEIAKTLDKMEDRLLLNKTTSIGSMLLNTEKPECIEWLTRLQKAVDILNEL